MLPCTIVRFWTVPVDRNVSAIIYYKSPPNYIKGFGFDAINQISCAQKIVDGGLQDLRPSTKTPVIISSKQRCQQHLCGFRVIVLFL